MTTEQKKQIRLHKELAAQYQQRYGPPFSKVFQKHWNERLLHLLPRGRCRRILDIGCGGGVLLSQLTERCQFIVGLDLSIDMLQRIKRDDPRLRGVVVGDASRLPFTSSSFSAVVSRGALHHFPDLGDALAEIYRVLETDGVLLFSEPSNDALIVRLARKILYSKSSSFLETDVGFITGDLRQDLVKAHFSVEMERRFGFLAYILSGFPDILPLMRFLPFRKTLTRMLIFLDKVLEALPWMKNWSLQIIMKARKK